VAVALDLKFGEAARETVKFIRFMDHFFDCFNVSCFTKGKEKRKCFLSPYRKDNDFRMEVFVIFLYVLISAEMINKLFIQLIRWLDTI